MGKNEIAITLPRDLIDYQAQHTRTRVSCADQMSDSFEPLVSLEPHEPHVPLDSLDPHDPRVLRAFERRMYNNVYPLLAPQPSGSSRLPENNIADILGRFQTTGTLEPMYMCTRGLVETVLPRCLADVVTGYVVGYTRRQTITTINDLPPKTEMSNLSKLCMMWLRGVNPTVAYMVASQATWEHPMHDFPIQNLSKLYRLGRTAGELGKIAILAFPLIAVVAMSAWGEEGILIIDVVRVKVTRRLAESPDHWACQIATNTTRTHLFWTTINEKIMALDLRLPEPCDPFTPAECSGATPRCSGATTIYPFGENCIVTLHETVVNVWRYEDRTFTHWHTAIEDFDGEYGALIMSIGVIRTETGFHIVTTLARGHICVWDDTGTRIQTILQPPQSACLLGETSLGGAKGGFAVSYDTGDDVGHVELFAC